MKLEKMDDFFAARMDGYDEHMRTNIEGASGFYAYTASLLPRAAGSRLAGITKTPAGQCPAGAVFPAFFRLRFHYRLLFIFPGSGCGFRRCRSWTG